MENINPEPWNISLEERTKELKQAKAAHKKIAIILYPEQDKASSFRYRGYNIYQATKNSKKWQLIYFFLEEISTVFELISEIDILIFGRITRWSPEFDRLAIAAKNNNITTLQDLDDCICGTKYIKDMFNVVSPDFVDQEYWINTCAHYELISYLADGFIVTNDYLGKILSQSHGGKPYKVIKNFLNNEQIKLAQSIGKQNNSDFRIGYFSGSHTHLTDFEVVYPEILQLLEDNQNFKLIIVGMLDLPETAKKYIEKGQIICRPMVDFLTLEKLQSEVDVNIAPLAENIFANCKSELKFFEAGLVKTPTVASPSYSFSRAIVNNKTGFLCKPGQWYDTITNLYNDTELKDRIASSAFQSSIENYSPENNLKQIEKVYDYYAEK
ncbi:glycosyltransferase [Candidatus Saccharibacteria bacterium]|nr:glycosyltransferase [Candidatus Saccharibacteria bacterium]